MEVNKLHTPYRAHLERTIAQGRVLWSGLALREKRALISASLLLAGGLMWVVLIQPALKEIDYWKNETPKLRSQIETLDILLAEIPPHPNDTKQGLKQSLRQSLDAAGLVGQYQLQTDVESSPGVWQLIFKQAPADAVINWLLVNPQQFSLEVVEAQLQRVTPTEAEDMVGKLSGTVHMNELLSAEESS